MAVREYRNQNPKVAAASAGVVIVFVAGLVVWQAIGGSGPASVAIPKRYFTTGDGNTYFADTIDKIPPFTTSDNKTAHRAHVVRCGTGAPFVAYVQKYTDDQKKKLEGWFADRATRPLALESVTETALLTLSYPSSPDSSGPRGCGGGRTASPSPLRGDTSKPPRPTWG